MAPDTDEINAALHTLLGVETPCETACTHVVTGEWTALGMANVLGRAERHSRQLQFLETLADGGRIEVNGVPWREMFERLNAIVTDPVPPEEPGAGMRRDREGGVDA